jgi:siderophore synthetase component
MIMRLGEVSSERFDPAIRALASALLREVEGWTTVERAGELAIELALPRSGGVVEFPLARPAGVGRLAIVGARWREGESRRSLELPELLARLFVEPQLLDAIGLRPDDERCDRFVARVRASADNLAAVVAARAGDLDHLAHDPLGFVEAEQGLLLGHSVHPAPRVREGIAEHEHECVPELGGRVQLHAWAVARERLRVGGDPTAIDSLIAQEPAWAERAAALGSEFALIVLHPVQHRALLDDPELAEGLRRARLRPLGPLGRPWAPTTSLRTLVGEGVGWMLKMSLPVRLTNSRRTLSLTELERGVAFGHVLELPELREFAASHPTLACLREPAWWGFGPASSFVALRENPIEATQRVEALASLLHDDPRDGVSRLARRLRGAERTSVAAVQQWFSFFVERVTLPIVELAVEHGVLLSAHQQNLVIGFEADGLTPARAWFRDAQGTAYSELARRRYGERVPAIARATFASPLAERAWSQSVVVNGVFNVIASLAMLPGIDQGVLLDLLRAHLLALRERCRGDHRMLELLLDSPQLWGKANVRAFAGGVDEVSLADPMTIQRAFANPLHRVCRASDPVYASARVAGIAGEARIELEADGGRVTRADATSEFALRRREGDRIVIDWPQRADDSTAVSDWLFSRMPNLQIIEHRHGDQRAIAVRPGFYQTPGIWTGHESNALLYRRHCAAIDRTFALRRFDLVEDLDRFHAWMNDPVVACFWEQAWPREQLREYVERKLADPHVIPAIGSFDERPFAYFEIYRAKHDRLAPLYAVEEHDRGYHMAVGDPEFRHRGWGKHWFSAMAHFSFLPDARTQRLVGEPRVDQARVRSWATSTAWREWGEIQFPHKRAVLMVLTRERFFAEFEVEA